MERELMTLQKCSVGEKIPVPPRKPLQLDDVPMWTKLPYDTKYPMSESSQKDVTLSREELGKSLYPIFPRKEFDLTLSPCPLVDNRYDSLHDPYLRNYFQKELRYTGLVRRGLVTKDGRVKSRLQEYNQYRIYLYHLWALEVNQLKRHQFLEEQKRLDSLVKAHESGDSFYRDVAEKYDNIKIEEILDEASSNVFQSKQVIAKYGFSPFMQSLVHWRIYQEKLKRNFRDSYPAVKQWLCSQTKHYKQYIEKKLNARRNREKKMKSRWEKLYENSRARFYKELNLHEEDQKKKRFLGEQRYNRVKSLWAKNEREIKSRRKSEESHPVLIGGFDLNDWKTTGFGKSEIGDVKQEKVNSNVACEQDTSLSSLKSTHSPKTSRTASKTSLEKESGKSIECLRKSNVSLTTDAKERMFSQEHSAFPMMKTSDKSGNLEKYSEIKTESSKKDKNSSDDGLSMKIAEQTTYNDNAKASNLNIQSITEASNVFSEESLKQQEIKMPPKMTEVDSKLVTMTHKVENVEEKFSSGASDSFKDEKSEWNLKAKDSICKEKRQEKIMKGAADKVTEKQKITDESLLMKVDKTTIYDENAKAPNANIQSIETLCNKFSEDSLKQHDIKLTKRMANVNSQLNLNQAIEVSVVDNFPSGSERNILESFKVEKSELNLKVKDSVCKKMGQEKVMKDITDKANVQKQFNEDETSIFTGKYVKAGSYNDLKFETQDEKGQKGRKLLQTSDSTAINETLALSDSLNPMKHKYDLPEPIKHSKSECKKEIDKLKDAQNIESQGNIYKHEKVNKREAIFIKQNKNSLKNFAINGTEKMVNKSDSEYSDVWKFLEISLNEKKREYQKMIGLEKQQLSTRRNKKIQKEITSLNSDLLSSFDSNTSETFERNINKLDEENKNNKLHSTKNLNKDADFYYKECDKKRDRNIVEGDLSDSENYKGEILLKIRMNDLFELEYSKQNSVWQKKQNISLYEKANVVKRDILAEKESILKQVHLRNNIDKRTLENPLLTRSFMNANVPIYESKMAKICTTDSDSFSSKENNINGIDIQTKKVLCQSNKSPMGSNLEFPLSYKEKLETSKTHTQDETKQKCSDWGKTCITSRTNERSKSKAFETDVYVERKKLNAEFYNSFLPDRKHFIKDTKMEKCQPTEHSNTIEKLKNLNKECKSNMSLEATVKEIKDWNEEYKSKMPSDVTATQLKNENIDYCKIHSEPIQQSELTYKREFTFPPFPNPVQTKLKRERDFSFFLPMHPRPKVRASTSKERTLTKLTCKNIGKGYSKIESKPEKQQNEESERDKVIQKDSIDVLNKTENTIPEKIKTNDFKTKKTNKDQQYFQNLLDDIVLEAEAAKVKNKLGQINTNLSSSTKYKPYQFEKSKIKVNMSGHLLMNVRDLNAVKDTEKVSTDLNKSGIFEKIEEDNKERTKSLESNIHETDLQKSSHSVIGRTNVMDETFKEHGTRNGYTERVVATAAEEGILTEKVQKDQIKEIAELSKENDIEKTLVSEKNVELKTEINDHAIEDKQKQVEEIVFDETVCDTKKRLNAEEDETEVEKVTLIDNMQNDQQKNIAKPTKDIEIEKISVSEKNVEFKTKIFEHIIEDKQRQVGEKVQDETVCDTEQVKRLNADKDEETINSHEIIKKSDNAKDKYTHETEHKKFKLQSAEDLIDTKLDSLIMAEVQSPESDKETDSRDVHTLTTGVYSITEGKHDFENIYTDTDTIYTDDVKLHIENILLEEIELNDNITHKCLYSKTDKDGKPKIDQVEIHDKKHPVIFVPQGKTEDRICIEKESDTDSKISDNKFSEVDSEHHSTESIFDESFNEKLEQPTKSKKYSELTPIHLSKSISDESCDTKLEHPKKVDLKKNELKTNSSINIFSVKTDKSLKEALLKGSIEDLISTSDVLRFEASDFSEIVVPFKTSQVVSNISSSSVEHKDGYLRCNSDLKDNKKKYQFTDRTAPQHEIHKKDAKCMSTKNTLNDVLMHSIDKVDLPCLSPTLSKSKYLEFDQVASDDYLSVCQIKPQETEVNKEHLKPEGESKMSLPSFDLVGRDSSLHSEVNSIFANCFEHNKYLNKDDHFNILKTFLQSPQKRTVLKIQSKIHGSEDENDILLPEEDIDLSRISASSFQKPKKEIHENITLTSKHDIEEISRTDSFKLDSVKTASFIPLHIDYKSLETDEMPAMFELSESNLKSSEVEVLKRNKACSHKFKEREKSLPSQSNKFLSKNPQIIENIETYISGSVSQANDTERFQKQDPKLIRDDLQNSMRFIDNDDTECQDEMLSSSSTSIFEIISMKNNISINEKIFPNKNNSSIKMSEDPVSVNINFSDSTVTTEINEEELKKLLSVAKIKKKTLSNKTFYLVEVDNSANEATENEPSSHVTEVEKKENDDIKRLSICGQVTDYIANKSPDDITLSTSSSQQSMSRYHDETNNSENSCRIPDNSITTSDQMSKLGGSIKDTTASSDIISSFPTEKHIVKNYITEVQPDEDMHHVQETADQVYKKKNRLIKEPFDPVFKQSDHVSLLEEKKAFKRQEKAQRAHSKVKRDQIKNTDIIKVQDDETLLEYPIYDLGHSSTMHFQTMSKPENGKSSDESVGERTQSSKSQADLEKDYEVHCQDVLLKDISNSAVSTQTEEKPGYSTNFLQARLNIEKIYNIADEKIQNLKAYFDSSKTKAMSKEGSSKDGAQINKKSSKDDGAL